MSNVTVTQAQVNAMFPILDQLSSATCSKSTAKLFTQTVKQQNLTRQQIKLISDMHSAKTLNVSLNFFHLVTQTH